MVLALVGRALTPTCVALPGLVAAEAGAAALGAVVVGAGWGAGGCCGWGWGDRAASGTPLEPVTRLAAEICAPDELSRGYGLMSCCRLAAWCWRWAAGWACC